MTKIHNDFNNVKTKKNHLQLNDFQPITSLFENRTNSKMVTRTIGKQHAPSLITTLNNNDNSFKIIYLNPTDKETAIGSHKKIVIEGHITHIDKEDILFNNDYVMYTSLTLDTKSTCNICHSDIEPILSALNNFVFGQQNDKKNKVPIPTA